jgi:hypothetical protein
MDPGPAPGPAIFVIDLQEAYYFFKVRCIGNFFKDKKSQRSHKTVEIKYFFA